MQISKADPQGELVVLARLREGEVFGEIALIGGGLTTATAVAGEKSVLLFLDRARFAKIGESHPEILDYLATLSEERLKEIAAAMAAGGEVVDADELIMI